MNTEKTRPSWPLGVICLLIVLGLLAGCYRPAAPDVTPTPGAGAEAAPPEEGAPDIIGTAQAESARATQMAQGTPVDEAPTEPPPTSTPTPAPTAAEATSEPESTTPTPTLLTQPTPTPTLLPQLTPTPTSPPTAGQVTHTVQRGENLFRIALRYDTTVGAIASANGIANPALIYVGQVLTIPSSGAQPPSPTPGGTTYVVQVGDNLFRIALRYNMSYTYLAQYNGIANPTYIYVGQVLQIPPR